MAGGLAGHVRRAWRESRGVLLGAFGGGVALIATAFAAAVVSGVAPVLTVVDPAVTEQHGRLVGVLSTAGVVAWAGAAALAALGATLVPASRDRTALLIVAAVSAWLAVDDQLMIHEAVSAALPSGELFVAAIYALVFAVLAIALRAWIPGRHAIVLAGAALFLSASLVADAASGLDLLPGSLDTLFEDSLKFIGIVYWATFVAVRTRERVAAHRPLATGYSRAA